MLTESELFKVNEIKYAVSEKKKRLSNEEKALLVYLEKCGVTTQEVSVKLNRLYERCTEIAFVRR